METFIKDFEHPKEFSSSNYLIDFIATEFFRLCK